MSSSCGIGTPDWTIIQVAGIEGWTNILTLLLFSYKVIPRN